VLQYKYIAIRDSNCTGRDRNSNNSVHMQAEKIELFMEVQIDSRINIRPGNETPLWRQSFFRRKAQWVV